MKTFKLYLFTASFLLIGTFANAQTNFYWVGHNSTSWMDGGNWSLISGGASAMGTPQPGDNVIFDGGSITGCDLDDFDLDSDGDIELNEFGDILFHEDFAHTVRFIGPFYITANTITLNGGTFDCTNALSINTNGNITISGGVFNLSDANELSILGSNSLIISGGDFIGGTSTEMNISGNITMTGGTFDGGDINDIIASAISLSGGAVFTSTTQNLRLTRPSIGSMISIPSGTFNHNNGTVFLSIGNSGTSKSIAGGLTFNNLTIDKSSLSRTFNFTSTTTVLGMLTLTGTGSSAALTLQNGPVNIIGGLDVSGLTATSNNPNHTTVLNFNASSGNVTLIGNTTAAGGKLPSITINLTGTATLEIIDNLNIAGNWTYTGSNIVTPNTSSLTFFGTRKLDFEGSSYVMPLYNLNIGANSTGNSSIDTIIGSLSVLGNLSITNNSYLLLGGNTSITGNITINSGCSLHTSLSNHPITLGGNFSNLGTFTPNSSVITLTGTATQSLDFRNTTTPTIHSLISSKSAGTATITDLVNISNLLQCTGGTLALGSNLVTLLSNSTTTAQVGNSTGGTYTGAANIQRFIPSVGRRWRFLAAPVTSGATVANSWRNGMFITGPGTGTGPVGLANYNSNGFDWTVANSPSIYTYNENQAINFNNRWVAMSSASTALNRGTGYRVFVRGDRSNVGRLDGSVTTQNEVTLTANGGIPHGSLNVPVTCSNGCTTDDGWNLIGNPYPATLDWNSFQTTNSALISGVYTVLNPSSNAYETWNGTTGSAGRYISSGQAFWVKSSTASANLNFTESHKATSQSGGSKFKTGSLTNHLMITLTGNGFENKAFVHQNTTGAYGNDNYDAVKFGYGSYQIATFEPTANTRLDINNLPLYGTKTTDTIEVEVNVPAAAANYQLSFADVNTFNSNLKVYLQDKMLNTLQDLSSANTYSFATNGTAGSTGNRFRVLITNQNNPLPVVFTALEASLNNNTTNLKWSTLSEKNNAKFIVERSTDMVNFIEIGLVKAVGNSNIKNTYTFTDVKPEAYTTNYYRIKQVDFDGKFAYSNIASITTDVKGNGVNNADEATVSAKVFPVPTKDVLNIEQLEGTVLSYTVVDVFGSEVLNGTTEITENGSSINVSTLANGIYFLVAKTDNGMATKTRFIVE